MRVLDLFCGAGGAARGYVDAGHTVVGVDIVERPTFPYTFWKFDALIILRALIAGKAIGLPGAPKLKLSDFDFIHASPPCQLYSAGNRWNVNNDHPDLVAPTRELLDATGLPYVIENVPGAPLVDPVELCGRMFGITTVDEDGTVLHLDRHRLFEANWELSAPSDCRPHDRTLQVAGCYRGARRNKDEARYERQGGYVPPFPVLRELMRIDWMTEEELFLAIPPDYTAHIARTFVGA